MQKKELDPRHSGRDFSAHGSHGRLSEGIEMYLWSTPATQMALLECFKRLQDEETAQLAQAHTHQSAPLDLCMDMAGIFPEGGWTAERIVLTPLIMSRF